MAKRLALRLVLRLADGKAVAGRSEVKRRVLPYGLYCELKVSCVAPASCASLAA